MTKWRKVLWTDLVKSRDDAGASLNECIKLFSESLRPDFLSFTESDIKKIDRAITNFYSYQKTLRREGDRGILAWTSLASALKLYKTTTHVNDERIACTLCIFGLIHFINQNYDLAITLLRNGSQAIIQHSSLTTSKVTALIHSALANCFYIQRFYHAALLNYQGSLTALMSITKEELTVSEHNQIVYSVKMFSHCCRRLSPEVIRQLGGAILIETLQKVEEFGLSGTEEFIDFIFYKLYPESASVTKIAAHVLDEPLATLIPYAQLSDPVGKESTPPEPSLNLALPSIWSYTLNQTSWSIS